MRQPFFIFCRICGDSDHCISVPAAAGWYLIHVVLKHWEKVTELHEASPEKVASALAFGSIKGWLKDIDLDSKE